MKNKIVELIQNSLAKLEIDGVDIHVETPKNTDNGDFSVYHYFRNVYCTLFRIK